MKRASRLRSWQDLQSERAERNASVVPRYRRCNAFIAYNSKARLPQFLTN
jgi:hypothetical protein